jgi:hypothetical protein
MLPMSRHLTVLATALVVLAGPASAADRSSVDDLIKQLDSKDPYERIVACEELSLLGTKAEKAVPNLIATMSRPMPATGFAEYLGLIPRRKNDAATAATIALGRVGLTALPAVATLCGTADDDTTIRAIRVIRSVGADDPRMVAPLLRALGSGNPDVQYAAAFALARHRSSIESTVPALADVFRRTPVIPKGRFGTSMFLNAIELDLRDLGQYLPFPFPQYDRLVKVSGPLRSEVAKALAAAGAKGRVAVNELEYPLLKADLSAGRFNELYFPFEMIARHRGKAEELRPLLMKLAAEAKTPFLAGRYLMPIFRMGPSGGKAIVQILTGAVPTGRCGRAGWTP